MIQVFYTPEFEKRYKELPTLVKKKAEKQERLLRSDPFYPSLHTEKLEPKGKNYWSFRVDRSYRIIFKFRDKNTIIFITCGHHNWIYRYLLTHN